MKPPSAAGDNSGRLDWRQVRILYQREMRAALREKMILVNSILIPLLLYPFIMWAMFTGLMFVQGQTEDYSSRVLVPAWPAGHPQLRRSFERNEQLRLVSLERPATETERTLLMKNGRLDAVLEFLPATNANARLPGNFQARLTYNQSKERSAMARQRVSALIDRPPRPFLVLGLRAIPHPFRQPPGGRPGQCV